MQVGISSIFLRKLHAEQASKKGTQQIGGDAEGKPDEREGEANLTEQIQGEIGIIPYVPAEDQIDSHTAPEFHDGDEESTVQPSDDARRVVTNTVDEINSRKAEAAAKEHTEMRVTAPQDLNHKIETATDGEEKYGAGETERKRDGQGTNIGGTKRGSRHECTLRFLCFIK